MFHEQGAQLILERLLAMVIFLVHDVISDLRQIRLTYRKIGIPTLPCEIRYRLGLQPDA